MANVTWQFNTVQENAKSEATRKKLYVIRETLAKDKTFPFSIKCWRSGTRSRCAWVTNHGTTSNTEVKMAKTSANAKKYISDLVMEFSQSSTAKSLNYKN